MIALEGMENPQTLGGYILGAIFEDSQGLYDSNSIIATISDLASNLEIRNGSAAELESDWDRIKKLTKVLRVSVLGTE